MIKIRQDLIQKEFSNEINNSFVFYSINLHNKFIKSLLNHYYCVEMCENWYDNEPDFDEYLSDMAYMYKYCSEEHINYVTNNKPTIFTAEYIKDKYNKIYTKKEAKRCSDEYDKIFTNYKNSDARLEFCNWQDPYSEGIWEMSQKKVDKLAWETFKSIQKFNVSKKDRLYVACKDDEIRIYFYGRDFNELDYWFIFKKRDRRIK